MGTGYNYEDLVRWEFFEKLLPQMLYTGTGGKGDEVFNCLKEDGQRFIYEMLSCLCKDDKKACPYQVKDFEINFISRDTVNMIRIALPPYNPRISDIVRSYILYSEGFSSISEKFYFIVKSFETGEVIILYVPPKGNPVEMAELTDHFGDLEFEYDTLEAAYTRIKQDTENFARCEQYWGNSNTKGTKERLEISENECLELLRWLIKNNKELCRKLIFSNELQKNGFSRELANFCADYPEILQEALSRFTE